MRTTVKTADCLNHSDILNVKNNHSVTLNVKNNQSKICFQEARKETTERYKKLPEVRGKREEEKTNRKKVENQIKTKVFAKKIQRQVLNQL